MNKATETSAHRCSNPWHSGASLGAMFFPACPSCGSDEQKDEPTYCDGCKRFSRGNVCPYCPAPSSGEPSNG
jgi:hypothetical protein